MGLILSRRWAYEFKRHCRLYIQAPLWASRFTPRSIVNNVKHCYFHLNTVVDSNAMGLVLIADGLPSSYATGALHSGAIMG